MMKKINLFITAWSLLFGQLTLASNLLEDQVSKLTQVQIENLKNITLTEGIEGLVESTTLVPLSDEDKEVLKLMGFTDEEIAKMGAEDFLLEKNQQKLADGADQFAANKEKEIDEGLYQQSLPGLASSTIGLGFAASLGLVIGVKCHTQPSALAFAGTSAAWIGLELMNWNNYQIEMEKLKKLGEAPQKFAEINNLIKKIETDLNALGPYLEELKKEETIESGIDNVDGQLSVLKNDVVALRTLLQSIDSNQMDALRSAQKSLAMAADVTKKKARNAKTAAIGYTAAAGLAVMEGFSLFGAGGSCVGATTRNIFEESLDLLFPKAFALSVSIGDLDKLGIPIGAGAGAAYLAFEGQFLQPIYASGWTRSATFGVMAGNAYYAAAKLKEAVGFLEKQAHDMEIFNNFFDKRLKQGIKLLDIPEDIITYTQDELLPKAKELIAGYNQAKEQLENIENVIDTTKSTIELATDQTGISQEDLKQIVETETGQSLDEIQNQIEEVQNTDLSSLGIDEFVSYSEQQPSWLDYLIPAAMAASSSENKIKPACFVLRPEFLRLDTSCRCQAGNSCTNAIFPALKPVKEINGSTQTLSFATQVMKANQMILSGQPGKGLAYYDKLEAYAPAIEKNTLALLKKDKKTSILPAIKKMHQSLGPAIGDYYTKNNLPTVAAKPGKKTSTSLPNPNGLLTKLKNKLALVKYIQNRKTASNNQQQISFKKEDFISPLQGEAIQRDSTLDIFQIIRQRYLKVVNDGRL